MGEIQVGTENSRLRSDDRYPSSETPRRRVLEQVPTLAALEIYPHQLPHVPGNPSGEEVSQIARLSSAPERADPDQIGVHCAPGLESRISVLVESATAAATYGAAARCTWTTGARCIRIGAAVLGNRSRSAADETLYCTTAFWTCIDRQVRHFLADFKMFRALSAFVFISRHIHLCDSIQSFSKCPGATKGGSPISQSGPLNE